MHDTPLLSIVINNYNYGRFLKTAIDSALCQSYPRVEVIVVDDGSTDHSRQIVLEYGDRVRPIFKANGGQASAFNAGFEHCRGEFVIFLDADDVLLPDAGKLVVDAFKGCPEAAKVQYRMEVIDASDTLTGQVKPSPHMPLLSGDLRRHYLSFPDDVVRMATSANGFPVRILRQFFPVPEDEYRGGADTYITHLAPLFGTVISLQEIGAYYRVHQTNNFEVTSLNLARIRRNITHARQTHRHIQEVARRLCLYGPGAKPRPIRSVSYVSNRLTSLKLEPGQHPIPGDRALALFWMGVQAAATRFDVSLLMRLLYALWFAAMFIAPRPLARWLAEMLAFPEKRRRLNRVLGKLEYSGN